MKSLYSSLLLFFSLALSSCGSSPAFKMDIDIGSNQSSNTNVLTDIEAKRKAGINLGISFVFDPLKCTCQTTGTGTICGPVSIDDVDPAGARVVYPSKDGAGISATKSTYEIGTASLLPGTFYRVTMVARANDPPIYSVTHSGTGDCPLSLRAEKEQKAKNEPYNITICFGVDDPNNRPICAKSQAFAQCPAASSCS